MIQNIIFVNGGTFCPGLPFFDHFDKGTPSRFLAKMFIFVLVPRNLIMSNYEKPNYEFKGKLCLIIHPTCDNNGVKFQVAIFNITVVIGGNIFQGLYDIYCFILPGYVPSTRPAFLIAPSVFLFPSRFQISPLYLCLAM